MLKFKNIKIQGFRSFQNQQSFDLELGEGLYFIKGENKKEPELAANGSGKSTIFEALTWCLFDKTSQSLRASDIKNWESKEKCKVEVEFNVNNIDYLLIRTWNPNSIILNDETVVQEVINDLLGINYDSFLHSVFISQLGEMFFDLRSSMQSEIMGKILNLDKWLKYSDKASIKTKEYEIHLDRIEQTIDNIKGKIENTEQLDYKEDHNDWELSKNRDRNVLKMEVQELRQKYKNIEEEDKEVKKESKEHTAKGRTVLEKLKKDSSKVQIDIEELGDNSTEYNNMLHKLECEKESEEENLYKTQCYGPVCGECSQKIPITYKDEQIKKKKLKLNKLEKEIKQLLSKITDVDIQLKDKQQLKFKLEQKQDLHTKETIKINNILSEIQKEIRYIEQDIETSEKRLKRVEDRINPFEQKERQRKQLLKDLQKDLIVNEDQFIKVTAKYDITKYWIKGFKEIRLFQIDKALYQFEIESNNALSFLGLDGWKIKFNIDRENKSGTISKGFFITILSPCNKKEVKWASWSGGEAQRLRIAGTIGLIEIIKQYSNFTCNIEAWDEPLKHLSEEGINDVVETLQGRASQQNKTIFLVDHRLLIRGQFKSIFKVIKDDNGSHIIEE